MDTPQKVRYWSILQEKKKEKQKGCNLPGYRETARIMDICEFQKQLKEVKWKLSR